MTSIRIKDLFLRLACPIVLMSAVTGCMTEDTSNCSDTFSIRVVAYDNENNELASEHVKDVVLYVFDNGGYYLSQIETQINQTVTIRDTSRMGIHVIAWGNLGGGCQTKYEPQAGDHMDACCVDLLKHAPSTPHCMSPDDLFLGEMPLSVTRAVVETVQVLPLYRATGSMAITIRGMKEYTGYSDDDFSVVVRETYSTINFRGGYSGEKTASYKPSGDFSTFNRKSQYYIQPFNLIPEENTYIDIYHGSELIATFPVEGSGSAITVERGMLTNVLIDFGLKLRVVLTDWGQEYLWKEF